MISKNKDEIMPTVGLVTFDAYVGMYAETLRYVSWKLQRLGCKVVRVGCNGAMGACTSFNSLGKTDLHIHTKEAICKTCRNTQTKIPAYSVSNVDVCSLELNREMISFLNGVEATLQSQLMASSVLDMHHLGIPLCKIAFFDFAITLKVSATTRLDELAISRFMQGVKDLLVLQRHFELLLQDNRLTHIVFVNGNYSLNTCVRVLCQNKSIVMLSIEPQLTSQHILNHISLKRDRFDLSPEALYPFNSELNISPKFLSRALTNFGARLTGGDFNAYTSLKDVCDQSEVERCRIFLRTFPRVHSFLMSSEDELEPHIITHGFTNNADVETRIAFKDQFEFTRFYLAEAEKNPEIGFIIRLHPRMAVNKRDAHESAEHLRYKNLFKQIVIASNVLIIFGDSKISSYFVISKSSLVIVSWSTIGLEALMMGIPVVAAFPNTLLYPLNRLSKQPKNLTELKNAIFTFSTYGSADDTRLFAWVSMAHEGQFFPTLAPRGQGGRWGKVYSLIYRAVNMLNLYYPFVQIGEKILAEGTIFSDEILLKKCGSKEPSNAVASRALIDAYRDSIRKMLVQYENAQFGSALSGIAKKTENVRSVDWQK